VKVRGEARFTAEFKVTDVVDAALVYITIANGKMAKIDTSRAEAAQGVLAVMTHKNAPRMQAPPIVDFHDLGKGFALSDLPIMQDDLVHWDGEPVAVAIAKTLEQAEYAASLVKVEYEAETPALSFEGVKPHAFVPPNIIGEPSEIKGGMSIRPLRKPRRASTMFTKRRVITTTPSNRLRRSLSGTTLAASWC
jgi:xanthine dehydrogenase YagR molybdenum-binding subunit